MQASTQTRLGALLAGLAVALGAFGAHAMQDHFDAKAMQVFETAVRYQMYHALAIGLCAALAATGRSTAAAATSFLAGTVLFSGSLYGLVFLGARWLGAVTPFGGVAFLLGWLLLALSRRGAANPAAR
ncbi:MAG TPA: DUF423 domain-containing protein [Planctomycetota bacterium]|nr:DUF423 domain-containing protein [Planctomycetota bacterium]